MNQQWINLAEINKHPSLVDFRDATLKNLHLYDTYEVSNTGQLRNTNPSRANSPDGCYYHTALDANGYCRAKIRTPEGKNKSVFVHRLVAFAFKSSSYFDKAVVNHKNKVRDDNHVDNLEWLTNEDNTADGTAKVYKLYDPTGNPVTVTNLQEHARSLGTPFSYTGFQRLTKNLSIHYMGWTTDGTIHSDAAINKAIGFCTRLKDTKLNASAPDIKALPSGRKWKAVPDFPHFYASTSGDLYSFLSHKIIAPCNGVRYVTVKLYNPITEVTLNTMKHIVIAKTFIPNPNNHDTVDHKWGNSNALNNLRWLDRATNSSQKENKPCYNTVPEELEFDYQDEYECVHDIITSSSYY